MPPASVNLTGATRYKQLFKIGGFTATKEIPRYTASTVCAIGGLDWRIEFHPKASDSSFCSSNNVWIMFRVRLISKVSGGVPASFSCRLVDPSPRLGHSSPEEKITSSVFYENYSRDIFLIRRCDLEDSGRQKPKDDCMFVQCALNVLEAKDAAAAAAPDAMASVPTSDLHQQFGELLRSQKGADITFLVCGEPVVAHRSMLAARSPVFMAKLLGDMKEKASPCVEIGDMEVAVFRAMLHFIYTDTVPELDQLKEKQGTAMAQHLLVAADRYGLKRLKMICVEKLSAAIDVDNVATTLALAEQHGCSKLKDRCMKFTLADLSAVSATEGYKHLEASCPWVLTELLKVMIDGKS